MSEYVDVKHPMSREPSHSSFFMANIDDERPPPGAIGAFTNNPAAALYKVLCKINFGHISSENLSEMSSPVSRSPSTNSIDSIGDNSQSEEHQLTAGEAARVVFKAMQKVGFGHLSSENLADLNGSVSTATSNNSIESMDDNQLQVPTAVDAAKAVFKALQKIGFGHLSSENLAAMDGSMSTNVSNNSMNSSLGGSSRSAIGLSSPGSLSITRAARNMFQTWEENISINTACKSMPNLAALNNPDETPNVSSYDEGNHDTCDPVKQNDPRYSAVAAQSYLSKFFVALDDILSSNGQGAPEEASGDSFPKVC